MQFNINNYFNSWKEFWVVLKLLLVQAVVLWYDVTVSRHSGRLTCTFWLLWETVVAEVRLHSASSSVQTESICLHFHSIAISWLEYSQTNLFSLLSYFLETTHFFKRCQLRFQTNLKLLQNVKFPTITFRWDSCPFLIHMFYVKSRVLEENMRTLATFWVYIKI